MQYKWVWADGNLELAAGFAKGVHHYMLLEKIEEELGHEPESYCGGTYSEDPFSGPQFDLCRITWAGKGNPPTADQIKFMIQQKLNRYQDRESMILERVQEERTAAGVEDTEPEFNFSFLTEPHKKLYPPAFSGGMKITPRASKAIKAHVLEALREGGYPDADRWIYFTVYGSGISYNWDEGGDFDVQMWVDVNKYNEAHGDAPQTSDDLVADVRRIVQQVNFPSFKDIGLDDPGDEEATGSMLIQYYPKPGTGSKDENLASKPYACYDLEEGDWLFKPRPITPEFYAEHFLSVMQKAEDIAVQAEALLEELQRNTVSWQFWTGMVKERNDPKYQEPLQTARQNAEQERDAVHTLFEGVFGGRAEAYSEKGEGINDERDIVQKLLEVWGVFQRLKHFGRAPLPWEEQELPKEAAIEGPSMSLMELEWWNFWYDLRVQGVPSVGYKPLDQADAAIDADKSIQWFRADYGHHPRAKYEQLIQKTMDKWRDDEDSSGVFRQSSIQKLADWSEIMDNAQWLRQNNMVAITNNGATHVEGTVGSQESPGVVYNTSFDRADPSSSAITTWNCTCPWGAVSWGRTRQWKKYEGRPCKHTLAMYWASLSQPLDEERPEAQGQQQLFNPANLAPPTAPGGANTPPPPGVTGPPSAQPPTAQPPVAAPPAAPQGSQPVPAGAGGTGSIPGALSKLKKSKLSVDQKTSAFFNGQVVVIKSPSWGIDRDGNQKMVPVGALGEILWSDDNESIAIFPLDSGILEPHLVRVQTETSNLRPSRAKTPFVRKR